MNFFLFINIFLHSILEVGCIMEQFEPIVLQPADGPIATSSGEQMAWITRLQDKEVLI